MGDGIAATLARLHCEQPIRSKQRGITAKCRISLGRANARGYVALLQRHAALIHPCTAIHFAYSSIPAGNRNVTAGVAKIHSTLLIRQTEPPPIRDIRLSHDFASEYVRASPLWYLVCSKSLVVLADRAIDRSHESLPERETWKLSLFTPSNHFEP